MTLPAPAVLSWCAKHRLALRLSGFLLAVSLSAFDSQAAPTGCGLRADLTCLEHCSWNPDITNCVVRCALGGVYFGASEDTTCHFVMHVPCVQAVSCWVIASDCFPYCASALQHPITWEISGSGNGLKITKSAIEELATVEVASSTAVVTPGAITVTAKGSDGGSKTGTLYIEVDSCSG